LYAREYPGDVSNVVALAPFLGERSVIQEIAHAGGVRHWSATDIPDHDYQRRLWRWLKRYESQGTDLPTLYLGYGDRDKFASGHRLLAEILPPERVFMIRGAHNWQTWKQLWSVFFVERRSPHSSS
jgi:hypothetical protein